MSNQPYQSDPQWQNYQQQPNQPGQVPDERQGYGSANESARSYSSGGGYAESQRESYVDRTGNRVESSAEVIEDKNQSRANTRYWIATVIYFILAVLEIILALRFLFRLLGASQYNGFIMFLYGLSHVFVGPFNGIFNDQTLGSRGVFELSTLVAMIIYALIAWGLVSLGRVIFAPNLSGRQTVTTNRRGRY